MQSPCRIASTHNQDTRSDNSLSTFFAPVIQIHLAQKITPFPCDATHTLSTDNNPSPSSHQTHTSACLCTNRNQRTFSLCRLHEVGRMSQTMHTLRQNCGQPAACCGSLSGQTWLFCTGAYIRHPHRGRTLHIPYTRNTGKRICRQGPAYYVLARTAQRA